MAKRRVLWHLGPDDIGTQWVGAALDAARDGLEGQGIHVAGDPNSWERATSELRRNHRDLGWRRRDVEGTWATIARGVWKHRGTSVLSTPGIAGATPDQVALALDGFRGVEVHLVFVVRNLADQAYAAAQARLEAGHHTRPAAYVERVLREDDHRHASAFAAGHHLPRLIQSWAHRGKGIPPSQVHVVAADDPDGIWRALGNLAGFQVALPPVSPTQLTPPALNALAGAVDELGDSLEVVQWRSVVRDWLSREVLPHSWGGYPASLGAARYLSGWESHLKEKGYDVSGHIEAAGAPTTADSDLGSALADAVAEVARLRTQVDELAAENERLDKKRRKLKSRLRDMTSGAA